MKKVKIQILINNISGRVSWSDISEPLLLEAAQARLNEYEKLYNFNKYQIVDI